MARKEKTLEENVDEFIRQLKNAGCRDKTINLVLKDIHEYQTKMIEKALRESFNRMRKIILESNGDE